MSYILEALKKAEAERLSAATHASPLPPGFAGADYGGAAPNLRRWLWPAAALAAALAGAGAWLAMRDRAPQAPAATPTVVIAAAPLPSTAADPADTSLAAVAAAPAAIPNAEAPAAPAHEKTAAEKPIREKPVTEKPAKKKPEKKAPPADGAAPKEAAAEVPVATLHDLPAQIRSEIPPLEIGGYIYSSNRADRSVLINKRLLREGDEITPGLRLEAMARDGMILNFRGYRYRAPY